MLHRVHVPVQMHTINTSDVYSAINILQNLQKTTGIYLLGGWVEGGRWPTDLYIYMWRHSWGKVVHCVTLL